MAETQKQQTEKVQPQFASDIHVVYLVAPAAFDNETLTVQVGRNVEAAMETQHGVLVQRRVGHEKSVERFLLPWANIRSVKYAAPPAPKA